ncbi:helix-turn-helix domain-containing protein [Nocardioides ungokensis]|uniref:helix-turn-helix domain-containing protein n=1 Tax=Nocardioides ungokensis TaxID=1643322 RepID=UPI0015DF69B1|nr:helix-turn-helix domain-containing protein [Nocardioides ungokensis]
MDESGKLGGALQTPQEEPRVGPAAALSHPDLDELPLLIPVPRVAKLLGISRSAAYRCAASGDLPTTHLGGRVYVVTRRLQALLESA